MSRRESDIPARPVVPVLWSHESEIPGYLRSKGAKTQQPLQGSTNEYEDHRPVVSHTEQHFARAKPVSVQEIIPTTPSVPVPDI